MLKVWTTGRLSQEVSSAYEFFLNQLFNGLESGVVSAWAFVVFKKKSYTGVVQYISTTKKFIQKDCIRMV